MLEGVLVHMQRTGRDIPQVQGVVETNERSAEMVEVKVAGRALASATWQRGLKVYYNRSIRA